MFRLKKQARIIKKQSVFLPKLFLDCVIFQGAFVLRRGLKERGNYL